MATGHIVISADPRISIEKHNGVNTLVIKHITEQEEAREMLEKRRVERWIIEKETELLQK